MERSPRGWKGGGVMPVAIPDKDGKPEFKWREIK